METNNLNKTAVKKPAAKKTSPKTAVKKTAPVAEKTNPIEDPIPTESAIKKESPKNDKKEPTTVAVFSEGKMFHPNLGRLDRGYNFVSPELAEKWMTISNRVREATPQEVASAFGV
jgi:hypothetical protein